jgi:CHAD domain-containing protein
LATSAKTPRRRRKGASLPRSTGGRAVFDGPAMMRLWARHWLDFCRGMPLRGRRLLDGMERDPAKRVHDFRRLMKAWRSLLKLAPPALAEEAAALRAEIKQLRQSFGASRDAAVVARTLQQLSPKADGRLVLPADRAPAPETVAAMRDALDRLSVRMEAWSVAGERGGFLLAAFRRSYRKARRAARHDPRRMSLERLHAWRTRVIDLGYQLSFFQPAAPFYYKDQIDAAERLRTHLGAVVDLDMADRQLAAEAEPQTKIRKKLGRRVARQRGKAAAMIGRVLGERPRTACAHLAAAMTHQEPRRIRLV